jgi:hypothetical protein
MEEVGMPILWPFGLFYGHLVYLSVIWYVGKYYLEKSGNHGLQGQLFFVAPCRATDVMIFKIVSPKNSAKKLAFLTQNKGKL